MGYLRPRMLAEIRSVKAEGGWGGVCTEYNSIHPSLEDLTHVSASLWDDSDIRAHALMTEKVHAHGALAGTELWYGGVRTGNMMAREVAMDMFSMPNTAGHLFQTRVMDKTDIRNLRRWHRKAALRARMLLAITVLWQCVLPQMRRLGKTRCQSTVSDGYVCHAR